MSSYSRTKPVPKCSLTTLDVRTLRAALLRAADWSDVHEETGYSEEWKRKERAFVKRCRELFKRLRPLAANSE